MVRFYFFSSLVIFFVLGHSPASEAQEKESPVVAQDILWGFDGTVLPAHFNLLSVLLVNRSDQPFQAMIQLQCGNNHSTFGAPIVSPIYLSARSQKWVQFSPYVRELSDKWSLSWNGGKIKMPKLLMQAPAKVFLRDSRSAFFSSYQIKTFPDNLFPISTGLTDNLSSLALAHTPKWEAPRRQSFLKWLKAGGRLHLCHDDNGKFPTFTGEMSELNNTSSLFQYGAGTIHRHEMKSAAVTTQTLKSASQDNAIFKRNEDHYDNFEGQLFANFRKLVNPNHNWGFISFILIIYSLSLLLGCFMYSRFKRPAAYKSVGAYVLVIIAFTLLIRYVGQRGYGETSKINSVSVARSLGDGQFDVTQWSHAFFTSGDTYVFNDPGLNSMYSTCESSDRVRAQIINGSKGFLAADIPLYSSRTFMHRSEHQLDIPTPKISHYSKANGQLELTIDFPETQPVLEAWLVHNSVCYPLNSQKDGQWFVGSGQGQTDFFAECFSNLSVNQWNNDTDYTNESAVYAKLHKPLMAHALGSISADTIYISGKNVDNTIDVFFLLNQPEALHLQGKNLGEKSGQTLLHYKLTRPTN